MESVKKSLLRNMLKNESSERKLLTSFYVFIPTKNNWKEKIIMYVICLFIAYLTSHSYNTVELFNNVCNVMLDVFIALFGIIFTGFIFFQALLNDELLVMLITTSTKKKSMGKSKLEEVNTNFVYLMMLYITAIIVSLILTIIMPCISKDFAMFSNIKLCNFLAWMLTSIFYIFSAELLWRVLSFIHNIYQLFNAYAVSRINNLVDIEDDDGEE